LAKKENSTEGQKEEFIFFPEKFVLAGGTAAICKTRSHIILAPSINPSAQSV
jgi:hypothetical protein